MEEKANLRRGSTFFSLWLIAGCEMDGFNQSKLLNWREHLGLNVYDLVSKWLMVQPGRQGKTSMLGCWQIQNLIHVTGWSPKVMDCLVLNENSFWIDCLFVLQLRVSIAICVPGSNSPLAPLYSAMIGLYSAACYHFPLSFWIFATFPAENSRKFILYVSRLWE